MTTASEFATFLEAKKFKREIRIMPYPSIAVRRVKTLECNLLEICFQVHPQCLSPASICNIRQSIERGAVPGKIWFMLVFILL